MLPNAHALHHSSSLADQQVTRRCEASKSSCATWRASSAMVKMEWERLEAPLSAVRAFCRARLPRRSASSASSAVVTGT